MLATTIRIVTSSVVENVEHRFSLVGPVLPAHDRAGLGGMKLHLGEVQGQPRAKLSR